jgi:DNA-binding transcriptional ArsR family regulator
MVNSHPTLDDVFRSLADPGRRRILERLARGEATLSALAEPLEISLPAVHKHVALLESAALVRCEKRGRQRFCRLETRGLDRAVAWIEVRRRLWSSRLDALDRVLSTSKGEPHE